MLNLLQILHSDKRLHVGRVLPLDDLLLVQVYDTIEHLASRSNGNHICSSCWARGMLRVC